jgi:hypothetical protein
MFLPTIVSAQQQDKQDKEGKEDIFVVVKDVRGEKLEGYLRFSPEELLVSTKDNQEKSIPLKNIEFIKLEKITGGVPGGTSLGVRHIILLNFRIARSFSLCRRSIPSASGASR